MNIKPMLAAAACLLLSGYASADVRFPQEGFVHSGAPLAAARATQVSYPVRIDRVWFDQASDLGGLWLPSTGKAPVLARFERALRNGSSWTWVGRVQTSLGQQAVIITFGAEGAVFGTLPQQSGPPLRIETRHGRVSVIEGGIPARILPGPMGDARVPARLRPRSTTASAPVAAAAAAPLIDVLVAYTPSLVAYYGSEAVALSRIDYLVALSNQAYADSQAGIQIRAVARKRLDYNLANDNSAMLDEMTGGATAISAQLHNWRTQYGADLVSVVRGYDTVSQTSCGVAWIGGYHGSAFLSEYGYSVVSDGETGGYYCLDITFAHELGHNMGSHHDNVTSGGDYGAYPYSRGHRQTITTSSGFATVMAYSDAAQSSLALFSNPRINSCMGLPCGIADFADNGRALTQAAPQLAALVPTVVSVDTVLPYARQDVNANGRSDIWLYNGSLNRLVIWFMSGATRSAASAMAIPSGQTMIATGDFNGDARSDFFATGSSRQLVFYASNGVGFAALQTAYNYTADYAPLGAADTNGNGRADLLLWSTSARRLVTWYMSGTTRTATSVATIPSGYTFAGSGDLNGDGKADLVWSNGSGAILVLTSTGSGYSQATLAYSFGGGYSLARVADVNGNGKADLLFRNAAAGKVVVWYMVGNTRSATSVANMPASETLVAVGDYDGDRRSDLLGRLSSGALLLHPGAGSSATPVSYSAEATYTVVDYR